LMVLFNIYFDHRPIGVMRHEPFLLRVDATGLKREPDLQIILNDNPGELTRTAMLGPADICIEIVSPESVERDFVTKMKLYEEAGVREYWILDYEHEGSHFYRLNDLWRRPYPKVAAIVDAVRSMLGET
jgi:Uma2 family endonuclease